MRTLLKAAVLLGLLQQTTESVEAKQVALEIDHRFGARGAVLDQRVGPRAITLKRVDYLVSNFALQTATADEWIEADEDLAAYLSVGEGRHTADLGYVPAGKFQAVRFRVGVDPKTNQSDPNQFPAGHALNPLVNDLHWGWSGGYVFLAIEGTANNGTAFSYHLANDGNTALITIPVEFDTTHDCTIHLDFDIAALLEEIDFEKDGNVSHSREGDPMPVKLTSALTKAITFSSLSHQRFQYLTTEAAGRTLHGTPYPLQITSRFPKVNLPEDNPLTLEGVALGRALFFDTRLSKNSQQSCASCHDPANAFADTGKRTSIGVDGIAGKRNAQPLFNLAWQDGFFWDGRAKTLREQVLMPITDAHEMNADLDEVVSTLNKDADLRASFGRAFGDPQPNPENLARALEQFLLTQISHDAKFDRATRGEAEFNSEEKRGLELFVTEFDPSRNLRGADCFHCHGGNLFSSRRYTNNGLDEAAGDLGLFNTTGLQGDVGKFKVPSLRNVAITGPYMHDGRFDSLEEVIDHYDHGVRRSITLDPNLAKHPEGGLGLSTSDKRALVAFLKTLTDHQFQSEENS